ncbi:MAG: sugar ABC transporter ATP-binding protein, partial [Syntrophobacteraceae bacterium]|nr:sugar ABC transporter ATP-binding protein [Syntrophobacteraceae bacterium]
MGWLKKRQIREWAAKCLESARVECSSPEEDLRSLSGGNQQKVALSRIMTDSTILAVLEQPGRGLDVHAQGEIHRRMDALSMRGAALVVISYDLGELLTLCHRMGILFRGRLVGTVSRADASREVLG